MHKVTGYVQPDIKDKLKALAKVWRCSESQALTRLIAEKKVKPNNQEIPNSSGQGAETPHPLITIHYCSRKKNGYQNQVYQN